MDRAPRDPGPATPHALPPAITAAADAFARRLDPSDPLLGLVRDTYVAMAISDPTLPDNPIVFVNPAFEALTGFAAAEVIGRNCRFMQGPLTDPADVDALRTAIARRERIEIDVLNHRRDGTPFWNRLMVAPVFDAGGTPRWFVASQLDVTLERHRVKQLEDDRASLAAEIAEREAALVEREMRLSLALRAGGLGTWTMDVLGGDLKASPSCKATFGRDPEDPFTLEDWRSTIHPLDLDRVEGALAHTVATGQPYRVEYRILTRSGDQRWVGVQAEMQYRADGTPLALSGFATDISDRRFAEEHRAVLARELTHRVKNTLATVGAVVSQTLRDAPSLGEARIAVAGRIASLGTAHDLLIEDEAEGAAVGDIVSRVLAPFIDAGGRRFAIKGSPVRLSPEITLALSMALYELATNAVKYGALSVPDGHIAIAWSVEGSEGERRFRFSWREAGGPPVVAPTRTGFGTRMIERVLARHVRGTAAVTYPAEGVRFAIEAPI